MFNPRYIANRKLRSAYEIAYYGTNTYHLAWRKHDLSALASPDRPVYSPFPVAVDLIRSMMNRRAYADKVSKEIVSLLLVYKLVRFTKLSLYTLFVTTPNCCSDSQYHIIDPHNYDRSPFTSYHRSLMSLRRSWHRSAPYLHDLVSSLETTFGYRVSFNVHAHGLLGSERPLTSSARHHIEARASQQISRQMNDEQVTVHIRPFKDEAGSHLKSIMAYIHYILKQYHLPVAKSMADYQSFMARPAQERHALVTALIKSTKGNRTLTHHISAQSRFVKDLAIIHRTVQPSLINVPADQAKHRQHGKHWTSTEQWRRAKDQQEQSSRQIIRIGAEQLSHAVSTDTYTIIEPNKKAVTINSNSIHTQIILIINDKYRRSGIPP